MSKSTVIYLCCCLFKDTFYSFYDTDHHLFIQNTKDYRSDDDINTIQVEIPYKAHNEHCRNQCKQQSLLFEIVLDRLEFS